MDNNNAIEALEKETLGRKPRPTHKNEGRGILRLVDWLRTPAKVCTIPALFELPLAA